MRVCACDSSALFWIPRRCSAPLRTTPVFLFQLIVQCQSSLFLSFLLIPLSHLSNKPLLHKQRLLICFCCSYFFFPFSCWASSTPVTWSNSFLKRRTAVSTQTYTVHETLCRLQSYILYIQDYTCITHSVQCFLCRFLFFWFLFCHCKLSRRLFWCFKKTNPTEQGTGMISCGAPPTTIFVYHNNDIFFFFNLLQNIWKSPVNKFKVFASKR